jgi:hypothetical protein
MVQKLNLVYGQFLYLKEPYSYLKKHKAALSKELLELGITYTDNDLIICTQLGTPLIPLNVRRTFNRVIKQADVPKIRFHELYNITITESIERFI